MIKITVTTLLSILVTIFLSILPINSYAEDTNNSINIMQQPQLGLDNNTSQEIPNSTTDQVISLNNNAADNNSDQSAHADDDDKLNSDSYGADD